MENPKTYIQLLAIAVEVMQANDLEEVFATEDGQVFYEKNRAQLHADNIQSKVYHFDNNKAKFAQAKEQQQRFKKGKGAKAETTEVEGNSEVGEATPQEEEEEEPTEDTTLKTEE